MKFDGKKFGYVLGGGMFLLLLFLPPPEGMSLAAWRTVACTALMAIFWITEALPIPATSLLPIVLFPLLGIMPSAAVTASYGSNVVYLFMGGFFLAITMERWNLHRRIAFRIIKLTGTTPSRMILGFIIATGFLSLWMSNTACAVMMVPIAIAVASSVTGHATDEKGKAMESRFAKSLMLAVAYAATVGGLSFITSTPANAMAVGMLERSYGLQISFLQWMLIGIPMAVVMLIYVWFMLTKVLFRTGGLQLMGGEAVIDEERKKLGPITLPEKLVLMVALFMVGSWIIRGFITHPAFAMVTDTQIAIAGALLLFMIPAGNGERLLDWKSGVKIPWGIVLLFGGGLAIANAFETTGLAIWISTQMNILYGLSILVFIFIVVAGINALTEITSNTAMAALFLPIAGTAAIAFGVHPFAIIIPVCFATSMAFTLPVATPPNAIVFGSGYIKIKDMAYAGILLSITSVFLITAMSMWWMPFVWGIDLTQTPPSVLEFITR